MKKLTVLLAIVMITSQFVGCGIFRRTRDHFCKGAFCGQSQPAQPGILQQGILPTARTIIAPQPPVLVPQAAVTPCQPCVTCSPVCQPCCEGGLSYPAGVGCEGCNGGFVDGGVVDGGVIQGGTFVEGAGSGSRDGVTLPGPLN